MANLRARLRPLCAVALAAVALDANAIYKCAGANATPIYQEEPCPAGRELRNFDTDPPNLSVVPYGAESRQTNARRESAASARPAKEPKAAREPKSAKADARAKPRGDPNERKHLRVGMSVAELTQRLGRPDVTTRTRLSWLPVDGDPDTITTVTIANGTVTDVDRRVVKK
jgi:hypothetical protein